MQKIAKNLLSYPINLFLFFINKAFGIKRRIKRKLNFIKAPKIIISHIGGHTGGYKTLYYYAMHKDKHKTMFNSKYVQNEDNITLVVQNQRYFYIKLFFSLFGDKNILNGGCPGTSLIFLLFAYFKKSTLVYTQTTEWGYSSPSKLRTYLVDKIHKNNVILCTSKQQKAFFQDKWEGQHLKTINIYNCIGSTSIKIPKKQDEINIIMIGTIQKRKGVDLYSKVADLAKANNQKYNFYWMGSGNAYGLYISPNVKWLQYNNDPNAILRQTDIFFLSSIDEPCSLAALEALNHYNKVVVYRHTGTAELIEDISGCGVYENYNVNEAYNALQKAIQEPLDIEKVKYINENMSSTEGFAKRLDGVLKGCWGT